eukprot:11175456-Lingulodinium_polyedra.AAC.1
MPIQSSSIQEAMHQAFCQSVFTRPIDLVSKHSVDDNHAMFNEAIDAQSVNQGAIHSTSHCKGNHSIGQS